MAYRISELDVPPDDPFRNDVLTRKPLVDFLVELLARLDSPFVLALDAPWGSGKTTLVNMLVAELRRRDFQCINFNAWRVDHASDPLVALVSSVDRLEVAAGAGKAKFKSHLTKVKKAASLLAKRGAVAVVKAATVGALDIEKELEDVAADLAGGTLTDLVDVFKKEEDLLRQFRKELGEAIALLPEVGKKATLIWFIDELDRCRPTFAIELLERIKHLFDVPNIVFVLSIDKQQLEATTAAVYGPGIKAPEYLRRFIDLEYTIPTIAGKPFTEALVKGFGLEATFATRTGRELQHDRTSFVDAFTDLADLFGLSLRARQRCITRMCVVLDQTPPDHYLDPIVVALLLVLRSNAPLVYEGLSSGRLSPAQVMQALAERPGGMEFASSQLAVIVESYLLASDEDVDRAATRWKELEEAAKRDDADADVIRARHLLEMRKYVPGVMRGRLRLSWITKKVDLASLVRN